MEPGKSAARPLPSRSRSLPTCRRCECTNDTYIHILRRHHQHTFKDLLEHENKRQHVDANPLHSSYFSIPSKRRRSNADVSIPGLGKLFSANYSWKGKIAWGAAITACFVACSLQIAARVSSYLETPVKIEVDVVRNTSLHFPSVTICPFYPFKYSSKVYELRLKYSSLLNLSFANSSDMQLKVNGMDLLYLDFVDTTYLWDASRIGNVDVHGLCELENRKNCEVKIENEDLETYFGMCSTHTFMQKIHYDGSYNGYEIYLNDYDNFPNSTIYWKSMILLHDKEDDPRHRLYLESGQMVHPNFETVITVQIKQYRRYDTPSQPCRPRQDVQDCSRKCLESSISANVTCRLPYMKTSVLPMCTSPDDAKHTVDVSRDVYHRWEYGRLCDTCPRKCVENVYSMVQNVVMRKDFTWVKILLQDNTVEVVKESPAFSLDVLVSEIGGNLGLFLGVCILTGLQILEIFVDEIQYWVERGYNSL